MSIQARLEEEGCEVCKGWLDSLRCEKGGGFFFFLPALLYMQCDWFGWLELLRCGRRHCDTLDR